MGSFDPPGLQGAHETGSSETSKENLAVNEMKTRICRRRDEGEDGHWQTDALPEAFPQDLVTNVVRILAVVKSPVPMRSAVSFSRQLFSASKAVAIPRFPVSPFCPCS
jgi:hypothetical protein